MMTNQLNKAEDSVIKQNENAQQIHEIPTRPGQQTPQNQAILLTACGLVLAESAEDEEREY